MEQNKENPKINIFICTHKDTPIVHNNIYKPIQVGTSISDFKLNYIKDNSGENISSKNKNYCELTALYWVWKNAKHINYIGLCHYRRYFYFNGNRKVCIKPEKINNYTSSISESDISHKLHKYDILLPERTYRNTNLKRDYCEAHIYEDFEILEKVITEKYPDYKNAFTKVMYFNNKYSPFNMFVTKWGLFDNYCSWLFDILFEVEKRIEISKYPQQARVFGYMSERLLNVYCIKNKLRIKYCPIIFIDEKPYKESKIKVRLRQMKANLLFKLSLLKI